MGVKHISIYKGMIFLLLFLGACKSNTDKGRIEEGNSGSRQSQEKEIVDVSLEAKGSIGCTTKGGRALDTGLKVWCWEEISLPSYSGSNGVLFSGRDFYIASECGTEQVTNQGDRLNFYLNPTHPKIEDWCSRAFNMRAEIHTAPWPVRHPLGVEEWFGWNYAFGNDYIIDQENPWLFFQVHHGVRGSPPIELLVAKEGLYKAQAGEIVIKNAANYPDNVLTGIIPKAGESLDIVVHLVYGDETNGQLQVWINGQKLYDQRVRTVYPAHPWGGNAKWGIYKWPWREESGVQKSLQQGIKHLETSMGTLRLVTRRPGDTDYGSDAYAIVAPR